MLYEYACLVCNHKFEFEQSIRDKPITECPYCLVAALKRLVSGGSGFVLRGSGWAKDLYSSKAEK